MIADMLVTAAGIGSVWLAVTVAIYFTGGDDR